MTESSNIEKRLADLERRHDRTRELLVSFISIVVAMTVITALNWERGLGWIAMLELVVAYVVLNFVMRWSLDRQSMFTRNR
jgi:hypothetical protein